MAQLVARDVRDVEAARSSAVSPTNIYLSEELTANVQISSQFFCFCYVRVANIEKYSVFVFILVESGEYSEFCPTFVAG